MMEKTKPKEPRGPPPGQFLLEDLALKLEWFNFLTFLHLYVLCFLKILASFVLLWFVLLVSRLVFVSILLSHDREKEGVWI